MADKEVNNPIEDIERLLRRIEKAHPDAKAVVSEIRERVRLLIDRPRRSSARRTGAETTYVVEGGTGDKGSLAEHRPSGQPLRVSKQAYDIVVDVLAAAERPLPFDELMAQTTTKVNAPADWQVRVVLRYLLRAEPEIIRRVRSRYQPVTPRTFKAAANRAWKATAGGSSPS